ncbi:DUF72 domain-containing protein [Oscillatoria sp. CS-180]|uniref:DUF72 domain-containing protein n=1 Tax=Oscillatoria sp. CS-180 TaxID=3021720 RepID=UPI00232EC825|nr:DUF72 domain-containing protein [Oscillatoria sp. CS-180]MDB9526038.1 DUF72 domain-containing protein [Oscillatoria sp. CS-180]
MSGEKAMFYLGCAVWAFKDWVGDFYPTGTRPGDFLKLYGDRLTTVEGNTTFYSIPEPTTVDRWAAQTPETFRFCPKIPRLYSHGGELMPHLSESLTFLKTMQRLKSRLGPVFLQLPPSYSPAALSDLTQFLTAWPRQDAPIAVEVRHLEWFQPAHADRLNTLLKRLGVGRVLLDTRTMYDGQEEGLPDPQLASERRKPNVPLQPIVTADFSIVRYISHPDLNFNEPYILKWIPCLQAWLEQGKTVYLFIHCPDEARSPAIARYFYETLKLAYPDLSSLPWDALEKPAAQLSLF